MDAEKPRWNGQNHWPCLPVRPAAGLPPQRAARLSLPIFPSFCMSDQNLVTLAVADGTEMRAYAAFPSSTGPAPGIILLQEAFGVNHHIRSVADRLAQCLVRL